jgi:hypothetical protein
MAPALVLIRQNKNRTRQIVACKRSLNQGRGGGGVNRGIQIRRPAQI